LALKADEGRTTLRKVLVSCDEALLTRSLRMGKPTLVNLVNLGNLFLGRIPGELKHLSNRRKRKQM
jgi:hypothetical protein